MRFFIPLLCSLVSSLLPAQDSFVFKNEIIPEVEGKLQHYDPEVDVELKITYSIVVPSTATQVKKETAPDAQGRFTLELDYPLRNQQIWLSIGDYYFGELLVDQGLQIEADLEALKKESGNFDHPAVVFSGPDGEMTSYINQYITYRNAQPDRPESERPQLLMDREMEVMEKVKKFRAIHQRILRRDSQFFAENPSPYDWVIRNESISDHYGELCVAFWGWGKEMPDDLYRGIIAHRPRFISNAGVGYYRYLSVYLQKDRPAAQIRWLEEKIIPKLESTAERERLEAYLPIARAEAQGADYDREIFVKERKYFTGQYQESLLRTRYANFSRRLQDFESEPRAMLVICGGREDIYEQQQYIQALRDQVQPAWARNILDREWEKNRQTIREVEEKLSRIEIPEEPSDLGQTLGVLPNGAELILPYAAKVEELIAGIRAAHPGKALIFDIWATWCGPCIYDMQKSTENIKKLAEQDVEVVYLCVKSGSNKDVWQKKVAELDLPTQHFFLDAQLSKEIMSYFKLPGYPSHLFFDREGKYYPDLLHSIRDVDFDKILEKR